MTLTWVGWVLRGVAAGISVVVATDLVRPESAATCQYR
jgi:hypothetical protein